MQQVHKQTQQTYPQMQQALTQTQQALTTSANQRTEMYTGTKGNNVGVFLVTMIAAVMKHETKSNFE